MINEERQLFNAIKDKGSKMVSYLIRHDNFFRIILEEEIVARENNTTNRY